MKKLIINNREQIQKMYTGLKYENIHIFLNGEELTSHCEEVLCKAFSQAKKLELYLNEKYGKSVIIEISEIEEYFMLRYIDPTSYADSLYSKFKNEERAKEEYKRRAESYKKKAEFYKNLYDIKSAKDYFIEKDKEYKRKIKNIDGDKNNEK